MNLLLTHSVNTIFNCAGVATPDPGEAPPLAGFNMKSQVAYIAHVRLFFMWRRARIRGHHRKARRASKEEAARGSAIRDGSAQ